jgi:cytochrome o ubiquinol oxidase subunit 1
MVAATFAIAGISWLVWLHHFFTMGAGPAVNTFFSVATMFVGVPTGVKVFNWVFTIYRGRLRFDTPMLWAVGGLFLLLVGGLTGMMLAMPAIDYTVHNSVFVVAHFHCMVLLVAYAIFGAVTFWFPKVFGLKLDERSGKLFFWSFTIGTVLVFLAMFGLGFMGETRRLDYLYDPRWLPLLIIQELGIGFYSLSVLLFVWMLFVTLRDRRAYVEADPWGTSRTLEWLTHTPVPFYNFAVTPQVNARDELDWRRRGGVDRKMPGQFVPIHMPSNTMVPAILGVFAFGFGFGLVWRIWWMAGVSIVAIIIVVIARSFQKTPGYMLETPEIARMERGRTASDIIAEQPSRPTLVEAEVH